MTAEAEADLFEIWDYIAGKKSVDAADKVADRLEEEVRRIGEFPGAGHFREDIIDKRLRFWGVYDYLIAYRWEADPIEVIAIVHGARDLVEFFDDRMK